MAEAAHIHLAAPCYGGLVSLFFLRSVQRLQAACRERGVGLTVDLVSGDPLITRARARLAARCLANAQATHLLFVDTDIGFPPAAAFRLLDSGHGVVVAVCPIKHIDWEKVRAAAKADAPDLQARGLTYAIRFAPTPGNTVEVEDGFARVSYGGSGFMMIRRGALQQVVDAHPELVADLSDLGEGPTPMVFDTLVEPDTGHYLSEDYAFCRRWRDLGGEIWADVEARLTHVGHAAYTGSLVDAMRPA
jgi:hypothetical protein